MRWKSVALKTERTYPKLATYIDLTTILLDSLSNATTAAMTSYQYGFKMARQGALHMTGSYQIGFSIKSSRSFKGV